MEKIRNLIKTVKSEILPKNKCRKIEGEYYKIGDRNIKNSGDCYEINGRYYKDNTGYIIFDHFKNRYEIFSSTNYIKGVVDIKEDKETLEIGFFLRNDLQTRLSTKNGIIYSVMNYSILDNTNYFLDRNAKIYNHKDTLSILSILNYRAVNNDFKRSLNYNISSSIIEQCSHLQNKFRNNLPTYDFAESLSKYIDGLSYGLEFETTKGTIPKKYCYANGVVPLRDGSIEGLEYVTLPLSGEAGINSIMNITKLLNKYTTFDNSCSLHMHIGNIPRTESFLLALFKVLCNTEDDFYKMFPLYKRINGGFKKKNYTKPLPSAKLLSQMDSKITDSNIKDNFSILFNYLSNGIPYSEYNNKLTNVHSHPYDPDNNRKWNVASRYHWVNLIPLIFGNKQTVEFRIHTPAKDPNKILMFLLLTCKLINFVKNNEEKILKNKINYSGLVEIIQQNDSELYFANKLQKHIARYISSRINFGKIQSMRKNFNYDEKEFNYVDSLNFNTNSGTSFLYKNEKENLSDTLASLYGNNSNGLMAEIERATRRRNSLSEITSDPVRQEDIEHNPFNIT